MTWLPCWRPRLLRLRKPPLKPIERPKGAKKCYRCRGYYPKAGARRLSRQRLCGACLKDFEEMGAMRRAASNAHFSVEVKGSIEDFYEVKARLQAQYEDEKQ